MNGHVMIDIETLGLTPKAVILTIGAVRFCSKNIHEYFYVRLYWQEQIDRGAEVNGGTLNFWLNQSQRLIDETFFTEGRVHETTALLELDSWFGSLGFDSTWCVWARSPTFDLAILNDRFKFHGMKAPWTYRQERCVRTASMLGQTRPTKPGAKHHALDDAVYQAKEVQPFLRRLKDEEGSHDNVCINDDLPDPPELLDSFA
jgi:hypothetical protein